MIRIHETMFRMHSPWLSMLFITAALFVAACSPTSRVEESAVDAQQKATAQAFATRMYGACATGKFEPLGPEAIPEMRDGLTPEKQKATCASTQSTFGDLQSLDYVETWKAHGMFVYRFKGHFGKTTATPEIRVVLDAGGKLAGFWLKQWADDLL